MKQLDEVKLHLRSRWGLRWSEDFLRPARRLLELNAANSLDASLGLLNGETYFFRYPVYLQVLREHMRKQVELGLRNYRVLSAGCSTGEEAYSIAFALQEECRVLGCRLEVIGMDARPEAIRKAHSAVYGNWSIRDRDAGAVERYLSRAENGWEVKENYRKHVRFQVQNLLEPIAVENVHAVLSCNVLLYMHEDAVTTVYRNLGAVANERAVLMVAPTDPSPPSPWRLLAEASGWPVFVQEELPAPAFVPARANAPARKKGVRKSPHSVRKVAAPAVPVARPVPFPAAAEEPEAAEWSDVHLWRAWARGELRTAAEHVRRRLFFEPEHPLWRFLNGVIFWENGWLRKSAAEIGKAASLLDSRPAEDMIGGLCTVEELRRVIDFWRQQHG